MLDLHDRDRWIGTFRSESDAADHFRAAFMKEYKREPARLRANFVGYPRGGKIYRNWNPEWPPIPQPYSQIRHNRIENDITEDADGNTWLRMRWDLDQRSGTSRETAVLVDPDIYRERLHLYRWSPKSTAPEHEFYITASARVLHFDGGSHQTTRGLAQVVLGNRIGTRVYQKNRNPQDFRLKNLTLDPYETVDVKVEPVPAVPPRIFLAPPIFPKPVEARGAYTLSILTSIDPENGQGGDVEIDEEMAARVGNGRRVEGGEVPTPPEIQADIPEPVALPVSVPVANAEAEALEVAALERALGRAVGGPVAPAPPQGLIPALNDMAGAFSKGAAAALYGTSALPTPTDAPAVAETPQEPAQHATAGVAEPYYVGELYVLQIVPDVDPRLVRIGYSGAVDSIVAEAREDHRTARLVGSWPIRETWLPAVIDSITRNGFRQTAPGMYRVPRIETLVERIVGLLEHFPPA